MSAGILVTAAVIGALGFGLDRLHVIVGLPLSALVLKGSFAYRSLTDAARSVRDALTSGDAEEARRQLSWHLVSRPVAGLDESLIASAAIESTAENFADSVAAPLFWYILLGLPGAWIYRFVDTADSILGYRDPEREWLGKAAARIDDIMCWIPARLAGWTLAAASRPAGLDRRSAAAVMRRDARSCSSPNSGWPMAAAAGALGIRLEKADTYVLNPEGRSPGPGDIAAVLRLLRWSLALWTLGAACLSVPAAMLLSRIFS